jgi:hypothetical protein
MCFSLRKMKWPREEANGHIALGTANNVAKFAKFCVPLYAAHFACPADVKGAGYPPVEGEARKR